MEKVKLGPKAALYPLPTTLVGANVQGKPNYLAIAWCGILADGPPVVSVTLSKGHYTRPGIKENAAFSVNVPSAALVRLVDYCGSVSGHKADKSRVFSTFYGKLATAPMIEECPLNLECKLLQSIELTHDEVFIGEVVETYADERILTDGLPDVGKIDPIVFSMYDNNYWRLGGHLGRAFDIGLELERSRS